MLRHVAHGIELGLGFEAFSAAFKATEWHVGRSSGFNRVMPTFRERCRLLLQDEPETEGSGLYCHLYINA